MFRCNQQFRSGRLPPGRRAACTSANWLRRVLWSLGAVLALAAPTVGTVAQDSGQVTVINREYSIKAAFLYHFSSYITWPPESLAAKDEPFIIAVFYADPFGATLNEIARTKTVAGRPIVVRRVTDAKDLVDCHIAFVPRNTPAELQALALHTTSGAAVLMVGESNDFIQRGGSAQFFVEGNKVRFAFRASLAEGGKLKISSKLLSLAKIVPVQ